MTWGILGEIAFLVKKIGKTKLKNITLKNVFLKVVAFQILWRHQMLKHKIYILLKNLESKHSLLIKLVHFMSYSIRNNFIKKFYKNCSLETNSRFYSLKRILKKPARWFALTQYRFCLILSKHNLKRIKHNCIGVSANQHAGFLKILFKYS